MSKLKLPLALLILSLTGIINGCKDEDTQTVPELTTGSATVTGTTVSVSGEIISNGGLEITASGFAYSNTNSSPTIADSFTEEKATSGAFTSTITGLTSSTTYFVRAYAINSLGAGYGNVVSFTTDNAAPTATNVSITGGAEVNKTLTVSYTYNDVEGNAESGTTFKWYVADNATGTNESAIAGATQNTWVVQDAQQGKYIRVGVTPKAATGNTTGVEVKSAFVGAVGEATTVTFTYNGQQVTYGIINSSTTGKKWLDRNLGAPNAPTAYNDYANYGDLFQWGRRADGHQLIVRGGPNDANMSSVNGTTSSIPPGETSSSDNPEHTKFIVVNAPPNDWRSPQNDNLWQGVAGVNNPCPQGWRLATKDEWLAENLGALEQAYVKLKITLGSQRAVDSGDFFQSSTSARYWTSTVSGTQAFRITITTTAAASEINAVRGNGYPCRCIKN